MTANLLQALPALLHRLVLPLLLAAASAFAQTAQPPIPSSGTPGGLPAVAAREPAPGDLSQWRRLVLPNGLRVLLLSDPKLNVSSAALAVEAGSLDDPRERQGLAHFLEHMLFLGTEKYPDITGFDAYLRQNSGVNNAYTAEDHTNYFLEIRHEAFEGALDRFAQFFVAPLFDARFTEREMNAVASEHEKNLESDLWRQLQLRMTAFEPGHPARHFGTGSRETLAGVTRDELLGFYQRHYSANRMALVLTGRAGLDELEHWARAYFAAVPDRKLPAPVYRGGYLPKKPALRLLQMEPVKDLRQLSLVFPLPALQAGWPHKSAELLGFVLGNEGPGSLLAQLKAEGLATQLMAGAQAQTPQYGEFELQLALTPDGQARLPRVLELVFASIRLLREQGLPAHLFAERRTLAQLDERYRDRGEGANLAAGLANAVLSYPLELAERVPYLWLQPDPAALGTLLAQLSPDNLLATLTARGVPTDQVEPIYGTRYSYREETGAAYTALLNPPLVAALKLPPPNPFIPARTTLQALQPAALIDEPALSLFHAQDSEFQRPQAALLLRHRLPRSSATLRNAVLLQFYEACVREVLNQTTYTAAEAGQRFSFSASFDGVVLATEGWDEANSRLLAAVLPQLADCRLSPARFADLKDSLVRGLSAFAQADAYLQIRETRRALVREFYATPAQMLPLAGRIELAEVQAFARSVLRQGRLEALAYGNITPQQAVAAVRSAAATLKTQAVPRGQLLGNRQLVGKPGQDLRSSETLAVNNSVLRRELLLGDAGPEARAAALVIAAVVGDPFYSELRTRQQLGYIVQGTAFEDEASTVALFLVQSGEHAADVLEARADAFIHTLPGLLAALPADTWQTVVAGVRARLQERDKSIAERAQRLFVLAYDKGADWARSEATLAALDALTQARAAQILAHAVAPETRQLRNFLGFARQHPVPTANAVTVHDRADWKRKQRYQ